MIPGLVKAVCDIMSPVVGGRVGSVVACCVGK